MARLGRSSTSCSCSTISTGQDALASSKRCRPGGLHHRRDLPRPPSANRAGDPPPTPTSCCPANWPASSRPSRSCMGAKWPSRSTPSAGATSRVSARGIPVRRSLTRPHQHVCPGRPAAASRSWPACARPLPGAAPCCATCRAWPWRVTPRASSSTGPALDGALVDEVIVGQVVPSVLTPNVAREVSLLPQFPRTIPAYTPQPRLRLGGTGHHQRRRPDPPGHADVIMAGGVESLSDIPVLHSRRFSQPPRRGEQGQDAGPAARHLRPGAPARPRAGDAGHRRAVHRRVDGAVGRKDGEGERHHAATRRTGSRCRVTSGPPPGTADGRLTAEIAPWFGGKGGDEVMTSDNGIRQRHVAGAARQAATGVRSHLRHGHGRQQLAAHRWGRHGAAHGGGARA